MTIEINTELTKKKYIYFYVIIWIELSDVPDFS